MAQTPDSARNTFEEHVAAADAVVKQQYATNDAWDIEVKNTQDTIAAETLDGMRKVRNSRRDQTRGGARPARDSKGW